MRFSPSSCRQLAVSASGARAVKNNAPPDIYSDEATMGQRKGEGGRGRKAREG